MKQLRIVMVTRIQEASIDDLKDWLKLLEVDLKIIKRTKANAREALMTYLLMQCGYQPL